jgi:hypothetical protein
MSQSTDTVAKINRLVAYIQEDQVKCNGLVNSGTVTHQ